MIGWRPPSYGPSWPKRSRSTTNNRGVSAVETCATCKHFTRLKPGHAAICMFKWRGKEWNDAVPLTTADDTCEDHNPVRLTDAMPMFEPN